MQAYTVRQQLQQQLEQVDGWRQQNEQDQRVDMQQLEGLMLQAAGGVEGLKKQLATQKAMLFGNAVELKLKHVQILLAKMHASSAVISGHLQRRHEEVEDIKAVPGQDAAVAMVKEMFISMKSGRGGVAELRSGAPAQVIPRSSIHVPEGALSDAPSGALGAVRAAREGEGDVALRLYNIRQAGPAYQLDAIYGAARMSQASHNNVVRCFGVVHDPSSAEGSSIHGSLVMEWVDGGDLCEWLQENLDTKLGIRVQFAQQVAAGLKHLHEQRLLHGDLKPQNVLLQFIQGEELPVVRACKTLWLTAALPTTTSSCLMPFSLPHQIFLSECIAPAISITVILIQKKSSTAWFQPTVSLASASVCTSASTST
jgi:serine/threonine protein kinase